MTRIGAFRHLCRHNADVIRITRSVDEIHAAEADDVLANRWTLRAAEAGNVFAQLMLAVRARDGTGFEAPDLPLSVRWFERAARR